MTADELTRPFTRPAVTPVMVARTAAGYTALGAGLLLSAGVAVVGRDRKRGMDTALAVALPAFLAASGVRLEVQGRENLWARRPAIFLMNHQSELDLVVLSTLVHRDLTGVVKLELRTNPIVAPLGWLGDWAFIDRSDTASAIDALAPVVEELRQGKSLGIAAEGHRSDSAMPGTFKTGAFHIAMQAQMPIVPVVLRNTGALMPPGARLVAPGTVQVVVLEPIGSEEFTQDNVHDQAAVLRDRFISTLSDWPEAGES